MLMFCDFVIREKEGEVRPEREDRAEVSFRTLACLCMHAWKNGMAGQRNGDISEKKEAGKWSSWVRGSRWCEHSVFDEHNKCLEFQNGRDVDMRWSSTFLGVSV